MKDLMLMSRYITYGQMMERLKRSTVDLSELESNWFVSFESTLLMGETDDGYVCVICDGDEGAILIESTCDDNHQFYQVHNCIDIELPALIGALTEYYQFIIKCVIRSEENE